MGDPDNILCGSRSGSSPSSLSSLAQSRPRITSLHLPGVLTTSLLRVYSYSANIKVQILGRKC